MNVVKTFVTVLSCSFIILAAGSNSGSGSNGSEGSNGGATGTEITGTVEMVSPADSMLVIKSDNKKDTVYVTGQTRITTTLEDMKKGDRVMITYEMEENRKVATHIERKSGDGGTDGSAKEKKDSMPRDTGM